MWKNKFVELLFSNDQAKINPIEAARLKYENFPSFLYKYMPFDENNYNLKSLRDNKIFLSDPRSFNDPYDCAFMLKKPYYITDDIIKKSAKDDPSGFREAHGITKVQFSNLLKSDYAVRDLARYITKNRCSEYKKNPKKLRDYSKRVEQEIRGIAADFDKFREYLLVSCFSEDYGSILMWSHYAKEHTGFCVQYDLKSLGYNNHLTRNLFPVIYCNTIFNIDEYIYGARPRFKNVLGTYLEGINLNEIIDGIKLGLHKYDSRSNNMFQVYAALIKYEGWKYEKEWRYVLYCQNDSQPAYINVPNPTAIYLGAKADENKDIILEIGMEKNIDVYQMQMKSSEYALKPKKLL